MARTALYRPDPPTVGSTTSGCISETTRAAPMGRAEDGAIVSERMDTFSNKVRINPTNPHLRRSDISRCRQS